MQERDKGRARVAAVTVWTLVNFSGVAAVVAAPGGQQPGVRPAERPVGRFVDLGMGDGGGGVSRVRDGGPDAGAADRDRDAPAPGPLGAGDGRPGGRLGGAGALRPVRRGRPGRAARRRRHRCPDVRAVASPASGWARPRSAPGCRRTGSRSGVRRCPRSWVSWHAGARSAGGERALRPSTAPRPPVTERRCRRRCRLLACAGKRAFGSGAGLCPGFLRATTAATTVLATGTCYPK